jgi:hypothetical protein
MNAGKWAKRQVSGAVAPAIAVGAVAGLLLALGACSTAPPAATAPPLPVVIVTSPPPEPATVLPTVPPISEEAEQALSLLAESQRLLGLTAEEQKHEYSVVNQLFAKNKSDNVRIRLAMLLTLPPQQDDGRALSVLEGVTGKNSGASPLKQLAALLAAQLTERQRQLHEEQKRADQLQQKLDGLKAIEKSLLGRDRKARDGSGAITN